LKRLSTKLLSATFNAGRGSGSARIGSHASVCAAALLFAVSPVFASPADQRMDALVADLTSVSAPVHQSLSVHASSEHDLISGVNGYFNGFEFVAEKAAEDNWATPSETARRKGGDCEDLAIAKYFALREAGIPVSKLRLIHVRIPARKTNHMVLSYQATDSSEPVVLDNLTGSMLPLEQRQDLLPVFSFNHEGLWLGEGNGRSLPPHQLKKWKDLLSRIELEKGLAQL
jgi:predicted transglutaminase-like cysteine proteinase